MSRRSGIAAEADARIAKNARLAERGLCRNSTRGRLRAPDLRLIHHPTFGSSLAPLLSMESKKFVYVLKNSDVNPHFYVGLTSNVFARVSQHNSGRCPHTASRRPWKVHVVIEFPDEARATRFERYLKSGSGRAFAKRHFDS
jgi:putative endonuclease